MNIAMPPRKRPPPPNVVFTKSTRATARVVPGSSSVYPALDSSPEPTVDTPLDTIVDPFLESDTTIVASTQPEKEKRASIIWTDKMEETMFDALLDQDRCGKRADAGFKLEA
jgi:hypothetical protein